MKKLLALLLALVMVFGLLLTGCAETEPEDDEEEEAADREPEETEPEETEPRETEPEEPVLTAPEEQMVFQGHGVTVTYEGLETFADGFFYQFLVRNNSGRSLWVELKSQCVNKVMLSERSSAEVIDDGGEQLLSVFFYDCDVRENYLEEVTDIKALLCLMEAPGDAEEVTVEYFAQEILHLSLGEEDQFVDDFGEVLVLDDQFRVILRDLTVEDGICRADLLIENTSNQVQQAELDYIRLNGWYGADNRREACVLLPYTVWYVQLIVPNCDVLQVESPDDVRNLVFRMGTYPANQHELRTIRDVECVSRDPGYQFQPSNSDPAIYWANGLRVEVMDLAGIEDTVNDGFVVTVANENWAYILVELELIDQDTGETTGRMTTELLPGQTVLGILGTWGVEQGNWRLEIRCGCMNTEGVPGTLEASLTFAR